MDLEASVCLSVPPSVGHRRQRRVIISLRCLSVCRIITWIRSIGFQLHHKNLWTQLHLGYSWVKIAVIIEKCNIYILSRFPLQFNATNMFVHFLGSLYSQIYHLAWKQESQARGTESQITSESCHYRGCTIHTYQAGTNSSWMQEDKQWAAVYTTNKYRFILWPRTDITTKI